VPTFSPTADNLSRKGIFDFANTARRNKLTVSFSTVAASLTGFEGVLPDNVESLKLNRCKKFRTLNCVNLSNHLQEIQLSGSSIEKIEGELPKSLKKFGLRDCKLLKHLNLNILPQGLEALDLHDSDIEEIAGEFNPNLKEIHLSNQLQLEALNRSELPGLTVIFIDGEKIDGIKEELPQNLKKCTLSGFTKREPLNLSNFPNSLEDLNIYVCAFSDIEGEFPSNLRNLDLTSCKLLELSRGLMKRLGDLEEKGCNIKYPPHFILDAAQISQARLEDFLSEKQQKAPSLQKLFRRFLQEGLVQRGGVKEVTLMVNPILDFIEKSPQSVIWMEVVAAEYLDGCINQPVGGMAKIAAWASVDCKDRIFEKLQAATRVLAQSAIELLIAKLPEDKRPAELVEAEFANVILRDVQQKLVSEGKMEPWSGVPKGVVHEVCVSSFITPSLIEDAAKAAEVELQKSPQQVADILCKTNHVEIWKYVSFPAEVIQIMGENHKLDSAKIEALSQMSRGEELTPEKAVELTADLPANQVENFNQLLAKSEGKGAADLFKMMENIPATRNQEMSEFIYKRTQEYVRDVPSNSASPSVFQNLLRSNSAESFFAQGVA
jgi:hypothetical protein